MLRTLAFAFCSAAPPPSSGSAAGGVLRQPDTICSPFNAFEYLIHSKGLGPKRARGSLSRYATFSPGGRSGNATASA